MWNRRISYHLAVHAHRAGLPPVDLVSIDHDDLVTPPGFRIEPVSIFRRAPPAVSHSLVSSNPRRTKQSFSLSRSTNERRGPESCSSFRSSEEPYAGFATVAFGCLRSARLGVLPVGSSRAPAVARVGVSDRSAPGPGRLAACTEVHSTADMGCWISQGVSSLARPDRPPEPFSENSL
jgi:hypothetical protein